MILWIIAVVLLIIFLVLLLMVWLRKVQFDAVHRNLLDLEDHFGGKVLRGGFAIRPRYRGEYRGQKITLSINFEKGDKGRTYYIMITMEAHPTIPFTILSSEWMGNGKSVKQSKRNLMPIAGGKYFLEVSRKHQFRKIQISRLEKILEGMEPFAYLLMAKTGMILERISTNLLEDTEFPRIELLLENMYTIKELVEGK